jgi:2,5-dihydroxypyridine 5,6-dioxygenase
MPTPANDQAVPIRSTGSSRALQGNVAAIAALGHADLVIDCTVEGILHAPELPGVLERGARVLMVSNEHPENFERYVFDPGMAARVERGRAWMASATEMHVTSAAGTDLRIGLEGAFVAGSTGITDGPGSFAHWPGGLVAAYPTAGRVQGQLVLATGDLNLTFKRYVEQPVRLTIVDDHVTAVEGRGVDAALFSSYLEAFGDAEARATSHVGWGMNAHARWDYFELYDKSDVNGTEARAYAGNFLYSTGANEHAGRFTAGHFDLPLRGCTITLDGRPVVEAGRLVPELAPGGEDLEATAAGGER